MLNHCWVESNYHCQHCYYFFRVVWYQLHIQTSNFYKIYQNPKLNRQTVLEYCWCCIKNNLKLGKHLYYYIFFKTWVCSKCQLWDFNNKIELSIYILVHSSSKINFQKENPVAPTQKSQSAPGWKLSDLVEKRQE